MANNLISNSLGRFRIVSFIEGLSFLILLGIAMPLKYIWNMPEMVRITGMAHGVLFISYCILLIMAAIENKWGFGKCIILFILSLLPFGFLLAEILILKKEANKNPA